MNAIRQCVAFMSVYILTVPLFAAPPCGETLASYQNVDAYSNGDMQGKGESCSEYGTDGHQFQCVEYVRRFYREVLGVDTSIANGWGGDARDFFFTYTDKGLVRFSNGEAFSPPQPNDILVFNSLSSEFGHIAVVMTVENGSIELIEQNWSDAGTAEVPLSKDSSTGFWTVDDRGTFSVLGWLRKQPSLLAGFTRISDMTTPRYSPCAAKLASGKVLIVGGTRTGHDNPLASAELYDPATRTFAPTGSMTVPRDRPGCVTLPDGRVLVGGGATARFSYTSSAEVYNPATGTFSTVGNMTTPRGEGWHTFAVPGGALLFGGTYEGNYGTATPAVDRFDSGSNSFSRVGTLAGARTNFTVQMLSDGTALSVGGSLRFDLPVSPATELYNVSANQPISIGQPNHTPRVRSWSSAVLPGGDVLVTSGAGFPSEIYRRATRSFETLNGSPSLYAGDFGSAVSLSDGRVLLLGYGRSSGQGGRIAEIFDPLASTFTLLGSLAFPSECQGYAATALNDGTVLITGGGTPGDCGGKGIPVAEIFSPNG